MRSKHRNQTLVEQIGGGRNHGARLRGAGPYVLAQTSARRFSAVMRIWNPIPDTMHLEPGSRCVEYNAHQDTPCRPSPLLPIIGLPALLTLADWCRKRQEMVQGGDPCTVPRMPLSPPAPEPDNLSNQRSPEPIVVGTPVPEAGANAARAASCAGSATALAAGRQGGAA